jgi:hypothetical protein
MTPKNESIVLVNFQIDHRDIFRVSMELAKWRFLVGIIIIATLVFCLVYFFLLIGEQEILLKTSPLFIGVPLVGFGGQILRLHASARKYVSALSESQRQLQFMFDSTSGGYDLIRGASSSHIVWIDVLKVVEKPAYFLVYLNRFEVGILPKRGFRPIDIPAFRDIVRSRLGVRAETRNQLT